MSIAGFFSVCFVRVYAQRNECCENDSVVCTGKRRVPIGTPAKLLLALGIVSMVYAI